MSDVSLESSLHRFRDLVNEHPRMKTLLKDWDRVAIIEAEDTGESFTLDFRGCRIVSLTPGVVDPSAPIRLKATRGTLTDIFTGVLNPASEFLDGRLRITASDRDQVKLDAISLVLWD